MGYMLVMVQKALAEFGHRDRLKRREGGYAATSEFGVPLGREPRRFGLRLADTDADRACTVAIIEVPRAVMRKVRDAADPPAASRDFTWQTCVTSTVHTLCTECAPTEVIRRKKKIAKPVVENGLAKQARN